MSGSLNSTQASTQTAGNSLPPTSLGSGPDILALTVSQTDAPLGVEFTVTVNGFMVNEYPVAIADGSQGQTQLFDIAGSFHPGSNTVQINNLGALDGGSGSLQIDGATIDGVAVPGSSNSSFSFNGPSAVIGSGPDTLSLTTSQQGQPDGAQFTIAVNGSQIGGVQTTTADGAAGQSQTIDIEGNFAPGPDTVSVTYLNASDSQLQIDSATINGNIIAGAPRVLNDTGSTAFSIVLPPTFTPISDAAFNAYQTAVVYLQSTVIGTVTPSVPGDTLSIAAAPGTQGTLSLGAVQADGSQPVIYTAPATARATGAYKPSFTITDQQQGLTTTTQGSVIIDPGPNVAPTDPSVLAATLLQPGQSEVIATADPGAPLNILTVTQTAGAGSVTVGANDTVVYTAPVNLTGTVDNVAYTVGDQGQVDTVSETAAIPLSSTGSIPISQINTPLVGAAGSIFAMAQGAPGQSVSETIAGYSLSLTSITPQVTGGAGGVGFEFFGGSGGNAALTIQHDDLGEYVSDGVTVSASATGGIGGNSETEGPGDGGGGAPGGSATLLADRVTARLGGPTTLTLNATGGAGGLGGSGGTGGAGGPAGDGSPATVTFSNSTVAVDGAGETPNDSLQVAVTATGGAGGVGGPSEYNNAGIGGEGGSAAASLTGDTLGGVILAIGLTAAGGVGGLGGSSGLKIGPLGGPLGPPTANTPGSTSITFTGNSVGVFSSAPIQTIGSDALGTLIGTEGELTLSLSESSGGQPVALSAAQGGNLAFTGNSFTGQGDDSFALTLGSGSYVLNAAAGSISIAGSAANAITGFDLFNMQGVTTGNNSFTAGAGLDLLELGGGTTTVAVTPQSGSLGLTGATASDLVLDLTGFGSTFSLAQLNADTSENNGNEVVALPDGQAITLVGAPVAFTAANTRFAPTSGSVTLGTGNSTLSLFLSKRAEPAGAQFTISVDGTQVGGVQTVTADMRAGQEQQYNVLGNFPDGANTVAITYLNAEQSLLLVDNAALDNVPIPNSSVTLSNNGAAGFSFIATGALTPVSVGSGPDTLALFMSERAQPAGAEFVVSVDGTQIGGTQTTTADIRAGQSQEFDLNGLFPSGPNTVAITYLNAADSVLSLDNATINGMAVPNSSLNLSNNGSASFGFTGPAANAPVTIGSGADILAVTLAERAQPTGAQFTIDVDGAQVGGVQTTTADATAGQSQVLDVLGNYLPGANPVTINYLNASNSLLFLDSATINGAAVPGASLVEDNIGSDGFSFNAVARTNATVIGSGPDDLTLLTAQRGQPSGAQFTVDVDGSQISGVQTTTPDSSQGQTQELDVLGDFAPGPHTVDINYLNANNSLLTVDTATINGSTIAGTPQTLNNVGSLAFSFATPSTPPPTMLGTGPDTLALTVSEDYWQANARITVAVDGTPEGGTQSVTAIHGNGQSQVFDVMGNFSGTHTVAINFLNAAASGGAASTLYLGAATINGVAIPNAPLTLNTNGPATFTFAH